MYVLLYIMLGIILCLIAIGYGNFISFIYRKLHNRIKWYKKDNKLKPLTWCCVKGDFVNKSDCHCINVGDDCSGCYIYEQNRTDIFINFDDGDEPF